MQTSDLRAAFSVRPMPGQRLMGRLGSVSGRRRMIGWHRMAGRRRMVGWRLAGGQRPALGGRRTAVGLPEHAAEQLVVGEAVPGKNLRDALVRVKDILAYMGKTDLTDIFQKGNSHILFEKTDKKSISAHIKSE